MSLHAAEQFLTTMLDEIDDEVTSNEAERKEVQQIREDMQSGRIDIARSFSRAICWLFKKQRVAL
jgi:hypothetical protein